MVSPIALWPLPEARSLSDTESLGNMGETEWFLVQNGVTVKFMRGCGRSDHKCGNNGDWRGSGRLPTI